MAKAKKRVRKNGRDNMGRFLPGHGGCKKKGDMCFNGLGELLRSKEPEILKKALEQAVSGKQPRLLLYFLRKMYGSQPTTNFALQGDLKQMMGQIISQVGASPPEALSAASKLLEVHVKIVELDELSERIAALETATKD